MRRQITGKVKQFDLDLSNKYDSPARKKLKKLLGEDVRDNPDDFKQDLQILNEECRYNYLELQVCADWLSDEYPHPNIYIFARKVVYGPDTLFLVMSRRLKRGYLFDTKGIENWKPRRLKKYSREWVYDIPWDRTTFVWVDHIDQFTLEWL